MKKVLVLVFKTNQNKAYKITLENTKEGLAGSEIKTAMNQIITDNVLLTPDKEQLKTISEAYYTVVSEEIITL